MGSKGSTLNADDTMVLGDWLQTDDGRTYLALEQDGLNLYWRSPTRDRDPFKAWSSGLSGPATGGLFAKMEETGVVNVYAGTPGNPGAVLWQGSSPQRPSTSFGCWVQDDGNFCISLWSGGAWTVGCYRTSRGLVTIQGAYGNRDDLFITSNTDGSQVMMWPILSETADSKADSVQFFEQIDITIRGQNYGFLLMNPTSQGYLSAWPQEGSRVLENFYIFEETILIKVDPGESPAPSNWTGLRPRAGGDNHFNIPGDGPYPQGAAIIMYHWVRPAAPNSLWAIG